MNNLINLLKVMSSLFNKTITYVIITEKKLLMRILTINKPGPSLLNKKVNGNLIKRKRQKEIKHQKRPAIDYFTEM
jgi:hypothetical protein